MDDDSVIVVDDVEAVEMQAGPSTAANGQLIYTISSDVPHHMSVAEHSMASSGRSTRSSSNPPVQRSTEPSERTTRSAAAKFKAQPKLKLKLSEKAAAQAPGMSFLGQYDRELDSDDEDLAFEEQFILRMPPGEDLGKLRKMVAAREVTNDVWFKFKGVSKFLRLEACLSFSL
jgi:transcription initiation factor TFIID subunit 7